ncbi:MAG TPA: hypothetical protein VF092_20235 [Longimicrobium sp.]
MTPFRRQPPGRRDGPAGNLCRSLDSRCSPPAAGDTLPGDDEQWNKLVLAAALDPDELWKYA